MPLEPMATPTTDPLFLSEVERVLKTRGEILVEIRYSRAAGKRDIMLLHSFPSFQEHLAALSPPTLVEVYRCYDLPLRGPIGEALIRAALALLGEAEYLIVHLRPRNDWRRADRYDQEGGWLGGFQNGEGRGKLEEDLRGALAEQAAVVPDADGVVRVGIY